MNQIYQVNYAGHTIRYRFLFPDTYKYFGKMIEPAESDEYDIMLDEKSHDKYRKKLDPICSDAFVEFFALLVPTSTALLKYRCVIFHSVSFLLNGKAWLITAPSGTGKTTQLFNWAVSHPRELTIINGDKTLLSLQEDGSIIASTSPWKGKESLTSSHTAPLGGIVYLYQGDENMLEYADTRRMIIPFFQQFFLELRTEEEVKTVSEIEEHLLSDYPVWTFINDGSRESSKILRETIMNRRLPDEL